MERPDLDPRAVRDVAARLVPGGGPVVVARAAEGGSTPVYRVRRAGGREEARAGGEAFYLRVAEGPTASLAPEALVHRLLRERGARVPEVVAFVPFAEVLQRSVMVTTAVPGEPIARTRGTSDLRPTLVAAGRDLALVNDLAVEGFGWIRRDEGAAGRLAAERPTHRAFALEEFEGRLARLRGTLLPDATLRTIRRVIADRDAWLDVDRARLAHGDLDATHIFHTDGRYTGIIDFGEIRGADRLYDLGHFALHDGERRPTPLLPSLLEGYREAASLSDEDERRLHLWAVLIGVRALARSVDRPRGAYQAHLAGAIRRSLAALLA